MKKIALLSASVLTTSLLLSGCSRIQHKLGTMMGGAATPTPTPQESMAPVQSPDTSMAPSASTSPSSPTSNSVTIQGMAFSPSSFSAAVGDTITITNKDSVAHTFTADAGPDTFDTGTIQPGSSSTVVLKTAGTFGFHCTIHPSMKGTLIVQ